MLIERLRIQQEEIDRLAAVAEERNELMRMQGISLLKGALGGLGQPGRPVLCRRSLLLRCVACD